MVTTTVRGGIVHTPRYLLRARLLFHLLKKGRYPPGRVLEVGPGRGEVLCRLADLGYWGVGLEISHDAARVARRTIAGHDQKLRIVEDPAVLHREKFDYLLAMEVLEHIRDDAETLEQWRHWLRPGGILILSVPAHMSKWTPSDEYVGHYRRYERRDLKKLLDRSGFSVDVFWNYGFPLTAVTVPLRRRLHRYRPRGEAESTREARTLHSAFESTRRVDGAMVGLAGGLVELAGWCLHLMQLAFLGTELGDGYFVASSRIG